MTAVRLREVAGLVFLCWASGCSGSSVVSPSGTTSTETPPTATPATSPAKVESTPTPTSSGNAPPLGTLTVMQRRAGKRNYTEGSIAFAKVALDGATVAEEQLQGDHWAFSLPAGSYVLTTYQRPCDGNCGNLDPPADVCSAPIEITQGGSVHATSEVSFGEGCVIKVDGAH